MNNLTKQDIGNIIALINQSSIRGLEALTVSQLQEKLNIIFASFVDEQPPSVGQPTEPGEVPENASNQVE